VKRGAHCTSGNPLPVARSVRRKEIYEALHPEARRGGDRGNQYTGGKPRQNETVSFCHDTAAKTRLSPRTVQHEALHPEAKRGIAGALQRHGYRVRVCCPTLHQPLMRLSDGVAVQRQQGDAMAAHKQLFSDLEAFLRYLSGIRSAETVRTYAGLLQQLLRCLPDGAKWETLTPADWKEALVAAYGGRTQATLNTAIAALRGFLTWAHERKRIPSLDILHHFRSLRRPRRIPRFLTEAEERAFVEWVLARPSRFRAACLLMLRGGLRRGEVRTFRPLVWERDVLWGLVVGKGGDERAVAVLPQSEAEKQLLCKYVKLGDTKPPFPYAPSTLTSGLSVAAPEIGFHVSPHQLRHTYATRLLERGFPLDVIQRLLGHSSVAITQIYAVTTPERVRDALQQLLRKAA